MKLKKKTALLASFTMGALLLATTALADIASKSGYEELKDAIKLTAERGSEAFDSFTLDFSMAMKDNGKTLMSGNETKKFDRKTGATESLSSNVNLNGYTNSSQTYSDTKTMIRVSESDPTYYVTEFSKEREIESFNNPFKEEEAADVEKIIDAIVGSLKDHVVITEKDDGSKEINGSLTEVQIPALVNAVASFQLKQEFNGNHNQSNMPKLVKDVFVKQVTGTAKVNKDGVLESILGIAVLSGKDEQGAIHEISVDALITVTDINSTTVTKPDLTGKKVVRHLERDYSGSEISNPEKYLGKFKNDILIEKDGKFVKIGERIIDITHIDTIKVTGQYHEEFKPGFEEYATNTSELSFSAEFIKDQRGNANFEYTTKSGVKGQGNIYFDDYQGKINFNGMNTSYEGGLMFDSTFSPDLD
ncbi:MAG TPA: hypothetical protein DEF42_22055 [Desulfosporosinus sp.]|nr:hypothetical protein [Desulfosporosinus sp.]